MPTATEVQATVERLVADGALLQQIVHGDATTTISTENGPVSSAAKVLKDMRDAAYVEAVEAAEGSIDAAKGTALTAIGEAAADLITPAPLFIAAPRTLAASDDRRTLFLGLHGPGSGAIESMVVPSHSVTPVTPGTEIRFVRVGTALINFVPDAVGDAQITTYGGDTLDGVGGECTLVNFGPDDWHLFGTGLINRPSYAYTLPYWLDLHPDNLRQERTGAAATTPVSVGDPIGTFIVKGTIGGYATALADARRPLLGQHSDGRYFAYFDGNSAAGEGDVLEMDGVLINLATLHMMVGYRALGTVGNGSGIVSFGPAAGGDVNRNDALYFAQNSQPGDPMSAYVWGAGANPARMAAGIQGIFPKNAHVHEFRKTSAASPAEVRIDNVPISHIPDEGGLAQLANATALGTSGGKLVIGGRLGNGIVQPGHGEFSGLLFTDEVLTSAQLAHLRAWIDGKTRPPAPFYPIVTSATELEELRTRLRGQVLGFTAGVANALPTSIGTVTTDPAPTMTGLPNLATYEKLTPAGFALRPRILTPNSARTDVFFVHWEGHDVVLGSNGNKEFCYSPMLEAGVPVVVIPLPRGPNDYTSGDPVEHLTLKPDFNEWVGPAVIAINRMLDRYPGARVIMSGISGGGWATLLCSAIDTRIRRSIQFVGWMAEDRPMNVDFEQWLGQIDLNYLELFLLSGTGPVAGRYSAQVLHTTDQAGFNRRVYDAQPDYMPVMQAKATALGGTLAQPWYNYTSHALNGDSRDLLLSQLP